jgi:hypothetical protein
VVSEDGDQTQSSQTLEEVAQSVVNSVDIETTQPVKREIVTNAGIYVTGKIE